MAAPTSNPAERPESKLIQALRSSWKFIVGILAGVLVGVVGVLIQSHFIDTPNVHVEILNVIERFADSATVSLVRNEDLSVLIAAIPTLKEKQGAISPLALPTNLLNGAPPVGAIPIGPNILEVPVATAMPLSEPDLTVKVADLDRLLELSTPKDLFDMLTVFDKRIQFLQERQKTLLASQVQSVNPRMDDVHNRLKDIERLLMIHDDLFKKLLGAKVDPKDLKEPKDSKEPKDLKEAKDLKEPKEPPVKDRGKNDDVLDALHRLEAVTMAAAASRIAAAVETPETLDRAINQMTQVKKTFSDLPPRLERAKDAITKIKARHKKNMVFEVHLTCTNSGKRALSLRLPAVLALHIGGAPATTPVKLPDSEVAILLPPNVSTKVVLITDEIKDMPDSARGVFEGWVGTGSINIHFLDSDQRFQATEPDPGGFIRQDGGILARAATKQLDAINAHIGKKR